MHVHKAHVRKLTVTQAQAQSLRQRTIWYRKTPIINALPTHMEACHAASGVILLVKLLSHFISRHIAPGVELLVKSIQAASFGIFPISDTELLICKLTRKQTDLGAPGGRPAVHRKHIWKFAEAIQIAYRSILPTEGDESSQK